MLHARPIPAPAAVTRATLGIHPFSSWSSVSAIASGRCLSRRLSSAELVHDILTVDQVQRIIGVREPEQLLAPVGGEDLARHPSRLRARKKPDRARKIVRFAG